MNIKNRFEKLSIKELIQLYFIVIFFFVLIYVINVNVLHVKSDNSALSDFQYKSKKDIKKLSDFDFLSYFNQLSKKHTILLDEVKILDNTIHMKTKESYQNIMAFLSIVNQNFLILRFELKQEKKLISLFIVIDKNSFNISNKDLNRKENIKNPFIKEQSQKVIKTSEIIVNAIIKNEVLINNSWYKKGDTISEYKILSILNLKNKIVFLNLRTNEKIIKKINNEV